MNIFAIVDVTTRNAHGSMQSYKISSEKNAKISIKVCVN